MRAEEALRQDPDARAKVLPRHLPAMKKEHVMQAQVDSPHRKAYVYARAMEAVMSINNEPEAPVPVLKAPKERDERLAQLMQTRGPLSADEAALLDKEFGTLLAPHREPIRDRLRNAGLTSHDAEELQQEASIALYEYILGHGFPEPIPVMFSTFIRQKLSKYGRAKKRAPDFTSPPSSTSEKPSSYVEFERTLDRKMIARRALQKLTPEHRQALEMVFEEGLTLVEAAAALGLPEGTLKSRVLAGKRALEALLKAVVPPSQR